MAINDWPEDDRPREKLLARGPGSLSDAELLAIFLRTGTKGKSAVDLARALLAKFGSLAGLSGASREAFCEVPGLGSAKYAQLQAATELTRRALAAEMKSGINLSSPTAVRDFLRLSIENRQVEIFLGLFMDAQNRVIAVEELFSGTLTQTSVFPRAEFVDEPLDLARRERLLLQVHIVDLKAAFLEESLRGPGGL